MLHNELKSFLNSEGKYYYFYRILFTLKNKGGDGRNGESKETFMCSSQQKANFEFSHPELKIRLCLGLSKEENSISNCKTLAQLTPSDSKTEKNSS
jgi:hypothetical protein